MNMNNDRYLEETIHESSAIKDDSKSMVFFNQRSITRDIIGSLDQKIIEHPKYNCFIYQIKNSDGRTVAIQRTFFSEKNSFKAKERKAFGKVSEGVAILKEGKKVIVSEGLETGLSVLQHLGPEYGLIVSVSANGMKSLADKNSWALQGKDQIVVAVDNDSNRTGANAARELLRKYKLNVILREPPIVGKDWNDLLMSGKLEECWL